MFRLTRPTDEQIVAFLAAQREGTLSYGEIGATRGAPPPGYAVDHNRVRLGVGRSTFDRAVTALRSWRMSRSAGPSSARWARQPLRVQTSRSSCATLASGRSMHVASSIRSTRDRRERCSSCRIRVWDASRPWRSRRGAVHGRVACRGRECVVRSLRGVATRTPARPPGLPARAATAASVRPRLHASDDRRDVGSRVPRRAVTG